MAGHCQIGPRNHQRRDAQDIENRTLFVVGDKKQSIYSFQGADADAFEAMKNIFGKQLALTKTPLIDRSLEYSFRSSSAILQLWMKRFLPKKILAFPYFATFGI